MILQNADDIMNIWPAYLFVDIVLLGGTSVGPREAFERRMEQSVPLQDRAEGSWHSSGPQTAQIVSGGEHNVTSHLGWARVEIGNY